MIKNVFFFVQLLNQLLGSYIDPETQCKQETKTIWLMSRESALGMGTSIPNSRNVTNETC